MSRARRHRHLAALLISSASAVGCGGSALAPGGDGGGIDAPVETAAADAPAESVADGPAGTPPVAIVVLDHVGIGSTGSTGWPRVGQARADVDWKEGPFAKVALIVDLESACFPFSKWSADPPPSGQNWPADCDAFDRNFNVFVDDTVGGSANGGGADGGGADGGGADGGSADGGSADGGSADGGGADGGSADGGPTFGPVRSASSRETPFEVIHAITPFGGPEHIEVDLTDLANALPGKHGLRFELGSYADSQGLVTGSNGGWTVSARVEVTAGPAPRHVLAVVPLYVGAIGAGDPFPVVSWEVPAGAVGGRLEYRTSGHGQGAAAPRCTGPAEEFCDRRHQIFIDGAEVDNIEPYREDCQTLCTVTHQGPADGGFDYCAENPCGAISSVEASRANWCPGSMTPPFAWGDLPALGAAGSHTFSFQILNIVPGGTWMASAIYTAYGP